MRRLIVPLIVIASNVAFAIWVRSKLAIPIETLLDKVILSAGPLLALSFLLGVRFVVPKPSRASDLVVLVVVVYLAIVHCTVLAAQLKILSNLERNVVLATAGLFVLLGLAVKELEHGSAFGVRVAPTLSDERAWREAHRVLGLGFGVSGAIGAAAAFYNPVAGAVLILACAIASLGASVLQARDVART